MTIGNGFHGLRVVAFESRMAREMENLIRRYGGEPLVAPALREIPLEDNSAALRFGARLITGQVDILVLLTGVGTKLLFDILQTRHALPDIIAALRQSILVARGPKPVAALKTLGLSPTLTVPEPNTWHDLITTLDAYRPVKGLRVAVQEYGVSNEDLLRALRERGAQVMTVPVYRWALPEDTGPLARVVDSIVAGAVLTRLQSPSQQRGDLQCREELAGYPLPLQAHRLVDAGEVGLPPRLHRHGRERAGLLLVVEEPGHRHRRLEIERGIDVLDGDQLAGVAIRQRPEQHRVHRAEDRGVRPDAQGQRQDDDAGEGRALGQAAEAVAEILQESIHGERSSG